MMTKTPKVGRPKKVGARSNALYIRLNDDEKDMLWYLVSNGGATYSNVIRTALRYYYHAIRSIKD